ncbi:conserved hypothetical protein [Candidatus Sulfopaludibacter sp. SbA3]|nr:conserved hypothetical protein [Candidatus Sulfopaludibacter sp. SbA3]
MPNQSGRVYGLTILSPIIDDPNADVSHDCAIRNFLATVPRDLHSPFAALSSTHICRLVVMDDVIYVGTPAREEHLQSKYLVFESNFDGDLDTYLTWMAKQIPDLVESVWSHCVGYPGVRDPAAFAAYMKKCQIETTFYFADVNNHTVQSTLRALKVQASVAEFIARHQGKSATELQQAFRKFFERMRNMPTPEPGSPNPAGAHQSVPLNKSIAAHHG